MPEFGTAQHMMVRSGTVHRAQCGMAQHDTAQHSTAPHIMHDRGQYSTIKHGKPGQSATRHSMIQYSMCSEVQHSLAQHSSPGHRVLHSTAGYSAACMTKCSTAFTRAQSYTPQYGSNRCGAAWHSIAQHSMSATCDRGRCDLQTKLSSGCQGVRNTLPHPGVLLCLKASTRRSPQL